MATNWFSLGYVLYSFLFSLSYTWNGSYYTVITLSLHFFFSFIIKLHYTNKIHIHGFSFLFFFLDHSIVFHIFLFDFVLTTQCVFMYVSNIDARFFPVSFHNIGTWCGKFYHKYDYGLNIICASRSFLLYNLLVWCVLRLV